jgi:hypothetical protein
VFERLSRDFAAEIYALDVTCDAPKCTRDPLGFGPPLIWGDGGDLLRLRKIGLGPEENGLRKGQKENECAH